MAGFLTERMVLTCQEKTMYYEVNTNVRIKMSTY
jgi:hypothetical protein